MQTRFVAYDRLGARRGVVPDPLEVTVTATLNELSTVSLHYARSGVNATMLDNVPELAVERWDGTTWVELRDARLRHLTVDFDRLEEVPTRRYDFIGVGEALKGVLVYGVYGLPTNKDGNPQFKTSNAGRILSTIWDNAVSRGWTGFSYSFSPTVDSNGQPWAKTFTISYSVDQNLLNILQGMVAQGLVDFYWQGRTLHVYNSGTYLAREKSTGASPIKFDGGVGGVDAAPEMEDVSNLATHVVVLGENKLRWEFATGTIVPEGRREIVLSYSGVDDVGTAQMLADPHILRAQNYLKNTTRQFHITDDTKILPFETYYVGDWVQVLRGTTYERMRIYSINLQRNANGLQGYVQLGDRIDDLLEVMYARIQGLTGGVANEGGTPPAATGRIPAAPTGLVVSSDVYIDKDGVTQGILTMSWAHSGKDTNGETIVLGEYDAYYRKAGTTSWYPLLSSSTTSGSASPITVYDGNLDLITYEVKVIAESGAGLRSAPSSIVSVLMDADTTAPFKPTTPTASTWLRTVTINWDGKGLSPTSVVVNMPPDLDHINVWEATNASMTGAVNVGTMVGQQRSITIGPKTANTALYYALSAVDFSGNESAKTPSVTVTPVNNVNIQQLFAKIDYNDLADKAVREAALGDNAVSQVKLQDHIISLDKLEVSLSTTVTNAASNASNALANAATADGKAGDAQLAADKAKLIADTAVSQAQNTVPDSTFDLGFERWDAQAYNVNNAAVITEATAHRGTKVLEMTAYSTNTIVQIASDYFQPVSQGQIWEVSAWVRVNGALPTTGDIRIACITKSDTGVLAYPSQATVQANTLTNTIQKVTGYYTVPAGIVGLAFRMRLDGLTTAGAKIQWSDIAMRDVTTAKTALDNAAAAQSKADDAFAAAQAAAGTAGSALSSANGKNNVYYVASLPSGTGFVDGDTAYIRTAEGQPYTAMYRWDKPSLTWKPQTMSHQVMASVDLGKATVGELNGQYISAGTLSTDKMMIGIGLNAIPDPGFLQTQMKDNRIASSTSGATVWSFNATTGNFDLVTANTGNYYFRATGVNQVASTIANWIPVRPGDNWRVEGGVVVPAGGSGDIRMTFRNRDGSATVLAASPTNTAFSASGSVSYSTIVPDGAYWAIPEIRFAGTVGTKFSVLPGTLSMYRMTEGSMVVNGTITSLALATNAVTAKQLLVGDFLNIAVGSDFEDATAVPFTLDSLHTISTTQKKFGTSSLRLASGTGVHSSTLVADTRVKEGEQWYVKFWAYIDASFNGTSGGSKLRVGDQSNNHIQSAPFDAGSLPGRSAWQPVNMTVTVPAGDTSLTIQLQSDHTAGFAYIDDIQIRRVSEASLIMNLGVEKLVASSASMDQAVIDKLWADVVSSRKITTDMMIVGQGINLIPDPNMMEPDITALKRGNTTGWTENTASQGIYQNYKTTGTTAATAYWNFIPVKNAAASAPDKSDWIPAMGGERYLIRAHWYQYAGVTDGHLYVNYELNDGTTGSVSTGSPVKTTVGHQQVDWEVTLPTNTRWICPRLSLAYNAAAVGTNVANVYSDLTAVFRRTDSSLIVDGTISALKIDLNDLSSDTGFVGSMRTNILTADVVTSTLIKADAITSKHTITGATIQTVSTASRGIKINSSGMMGYDSTGATIMNIGNGSQNLLVGDFMTSKAGVGGVRLINSSEWGLPAIIYSYNGNQTVQEAASFMRYSISGDPELVHRAPNRAIVGGTGLGFVRVEGDLVLSLGNGVGGAQQMRVEQPFNLDAWSPQTGYQAMTLNGKLTTINAVGGNLKLDAGAFYVQMPSTYGKTTGTSGNVVISSDGGLFRSTSALKYKADPQVIEPDERLLDVPMKDWVDKFALESKEALEAIPVEDWDESIQARYDSISIERIPGAIAEDVIAAGGERYATYGASGEVEGLMYDRYTLARTDILARKYRALSERLQALEEAFFA